MAAGGILGAIGGVVGAFGGYQARTRLVRALRVPDFVIACLEDAVAIGVGVAFMANAVLGYLITRGQVDDVSQALVWMVGSLANASWGGIAVLAVTLVVLLPCVAVLAPRLR